MTRLTRNATQVLNNLNNPENDDDDNNDEPSQYAKSKAKGKKATAKFVKEKWATSALSKKRTLLENKISQNLTQIDHSTNRNSSSSSVAVAKDSNQRQSSNLFISEAQSNDSDELSNTLCPAVISNTVLTQNNEITYTNYLSTMTKSL